MIEAIIAILMALISYFTAKKKGNMSDTQAALVAAAAGAGTYYVASETEWGQTAMTALSGYTGIPSSAGITIADGVTLVGTTTAADGTVTETYSDGSTVVENPDGTVTATAPTGQSTTTLPDGTKVTTSVPRTGAPATRSGSGVPDVLKSWGATGTATVLGTTAAIASGAFEKYLPWIIGGAVALVLLK